MAIALRLFIPLIFLALGWWGFQKYSVEAPPEPEQPPVPRRLETTIKPLVRQDFEISLTSQGIVRPHNETSITPRVAGRVVVISEQFENGAFFDEGDVLVELDPTDFLSDVSAAEARLARAEATLAQENARAEQARLDWADLGYTGEPTDLVLRKPQLKEAEANVKAAQAALGDSHRALERSKIRAPYRGRVLERLVGLGQSVSSGTRLGTIFSTDFAEVRLSLSPRNLTYIQLPTTASDDPIPVVLTDALANDEPQTWPGEIVRTEGALDEGSRKLFVIARINQPFSPKDGTAPLHIGQPLRATFAGGVIEDVFVVPREAERKPGEIVLIEPETQKLRRKPITPIWTDKSHLVVRDGLPEDWWLSTSRLPAYPNGARVEILPDPEDPAAPAGLELGKKSQSATPEA